MTPALERALPDERLGEIRSGAIESYDFDAGLGVLVEGNERIEFHCTAIADGTRDIAPGTRVHFLLRPALDGRFEASAITPV